MSDPNTNPPRPVGEPPRPVGEPPNPRPGSGNLVWIIAAVVIVLGIIWYVMRDTTPSATAVPPATETTAPVTETPAPTAVPPATETPAPAPAEAPADVPATDAPATDAPATGAPTTN